MNEHEKIYVITVTEEDGSSAPGVFEKAFKTEAEAVEFLKAVKYKEHGRGLMGMVYREDGYQTTYVRINELKISNG